MSPSNWCSTQILSCHFLLKLLIDSLLPTQSILDLLSYCIGLFVFCALPNFLIMLYLISYYINRKLFSGSEILFYPRNKVRSWPFTISRMLTIHKRLQGLRQRSLLFTVQQKPSEPVRLHWFPLPRRIMKAFQKAQLNDVHMVGFHQNWGIYCFYNSNY